MVLSVAFLTLSSFNLATLTKDVDRRSQAQIWPKEAPDPTDAEQNHGRNDGGKSGGNKTCLSFFAKKRSVQKGTHTELGKSLWRIVH